MKIISIIALCIIALSITASAASIWGREINNNIFGVRYNDTRARLEFFGAYLNFTYLYDVPAALGGGTTIPITNTTGGNSTACSSTDKVNNVTLKNGLLTIGCGSDVSGGGSGSNVTLPINITNVTKLSTSINCSTSDKIHNLTINDSGVFASCQGDTDTNSGGTVTSISGGTGLVFSVNPITTTGTISLGGITLPAANITDIQNQSYSNLSGTITLGAANISGDLSSWNNDILLNYANLTGTISLGPVNITNLANSHLHSFNNLTGTLGGFGYSNLTGTASIGYANLTGTISLTGANITGLDSSHTHAAENITSGTIADARLSANITRGAYHNTTSLPAANITSGTMSGEFNMTGNFTTGNWKFVTNSSTEGTIYFNGIWVFIKNSTGVYIQG